VLSGEGRAFCAGLDMGSFGAMAEVAARPARAPRSPTDTALASRTHGIANRAQYAVWVWREIPVPVIAAVHGVAFGGGFQLALGADMRFVAPDARLAVLEIKWGLVPDMAGTQLMRHLAREDVVRELTYTGRIFSGEEAAALGFATRVCADPRAEALSVAREIATKNPHAIRGAKRLLNAAVDIGPAAGFLQETAEQIALIGSPNQVEAVMANMQRRDPVFADPAP
jgi:enoyl-CoA hydratase/carnithine racemase